MTRTKWFQILFLYVSLPCFADSVLDEALGDYSAMQFYLETRTKFALEYVEAARAEDIDRILNVGCMELEISLRSLNPKAFDGEYEQDRVAALRMKAIKQYVELKSQGYCDYERAISK